MKIQYGNSEFTINSQPIVDSLVNPDFVTEINSIENAFTVTLSEDGLGIAYQGLENVNIFLNDVKVVRNG